MTEASARGGQPQEFEKVLTGSDTAVAQFEIARDGAGTETAAAQRIWRARFSLDVEPNGPVHALVTLSGGRASGRGGGERKTPGSRRYKPIEAAPGRYVREKA